MQMGILGLIANKYLHNVIKVCYYFCSLAPIASGAAPNPQHQESTTVFSAPSRNLLHEVMFSTGGPIMKSSASCNFFVAFHIQLVCEYRQYKEIRL